MKKDKTFRPDRVLSYFKAEWLPLAFVTLSGLVYNIGLLATPWFEGRLAQCLADILGGSETAAKMAMLVLAYIVVTLAVQAARFIKRFYVRRFANNINRRMKGILYANLVRQSRAALEKEGAGELMTKAISDVDDCVEGMRKFTTEIFDTGVALVGYAVMLLVYDWRLALLSLLFTPFSYMCAAWMKKPVQRAGAAYKKAASALSAATLDRARNAVTYRIYGCEDARVEKYEEALNTYEKTAVRNNVWQSALPPLYLAASEAGVLFILWFGAKNVLGSGWSTWDIAAFTTFLSCFTKLVVKSSKVAKLFNSVQKAEVSWKRIKPLMKQPEQLEALNIPAAQDVTLENLSFSYGEGPIFSGLSLTAHPGDIVGITGPVACGKSTFGRVFLCEAPYGGSAKFGKTEFAALTPRQISATVGYLGHDPELSADTVQNNVLCGSEQDAMPWLAAAALDGEVLAMENGVDTVIGPSGSGKSTLLRCLNKLETINRGTIIIDGELLADTNSTGEVVYAPGDESRRIACKMGMVFQQFNLFPHMTVLQNLIEAPVQVQKRDRTEVIEEAKILLGKVGLSEKADVYPRKLSGGQQQRVAIARALVNNPAVILADEATGNLDSRTSFEILVLFQKLHAEGRTIIFVTHNPELSQYSSRNIRLRDGQVIEDTTNPKILSAAEALAALPKNDED